MNSDNCLTVSKYQNPYLKKSAVKNNLTPDSVGGEEDAAFDKFLASQFFEIDKKKEEE